MKTLRIQYYELLNQYVIMVAEPIHSKALLPAVYLLTQLRVSVSCRCCDEVQEARGGGRGFIGGGGKGVVIHILTPSHDMHTHSTLM